MTPRVQIGKHWHPTPFPRELTYEELWAQRLLIGGGVRHRHTREIDWAWVTFLVVLAMTLVMVWKH